MLLQHLNSFKNSKFPYIKLVAGAGFEIAAVPAPEGYGSRVTLVSVHRDGDLGLCSRRGMAVCLHTHLPLPLCSKENNTINLISQQFVASYQKRS